MYPVFSNSINIGDSNSVRIGQTVFAIGNPIGFEFQRTVTSGIVSGLNRTIKIEDENLIATQISKSNASYFPEISREKALELAPTAEPIEWKLNIKNSSELEGTKYTLTEKDKNDVKLSVKVVYNKEIVEEKMRNARRTGAGG